MMTATNPCRHWPLFEYLYSYRMNTPDKITFHIGSYIPFKNQMLFTIDCLYHFTHHGLISQLLPNPSLTNTMDVNILYSWGLEQNISIPTIWHMQSPSTSTSQSNSPEAYKNKCHHLFTRIARHSIRINATPLSNNTTAAHLPHRDHIPTELIHISDDNTNRCLNQMMPTNTPTRWPQTMLPLWHNQTHCTPLP